MPLRPIVSLPDSGYEPLTKKLASCLETLPEARIETSTEEMEKKLCNVELKPGEIMVSLDVKSLFTNVQVEESLQRAADMLYASDKQPEFSKEIFVELLRLAVKGVCFLSGGEWYMQSDGVAKGSALAMILSNIWLHQFESSIGGPVDPAEEACQEKEEVLTEAPAPATKYPCGKCAKAVTYVGYSIRCVQ